MLQPLIAAVTTTATFPHTAAYILSLGEALHHELKHHGVHVTVLSPGPTETQMPREMGLDFAKLPVEVMSVEPVAATGMRALERGQPTTIPGGMNRTMAVVGSLFGRARMAARFAEMMAAAMGSA